MNDPQIFYDTSTTTLNSAYYTTEIELTGSVRYKINVEMLNKVFYLCARTKKVNYCRLASITVTCNLAVVTATIKLSYPQNSLSYSQLPAVPLTWFSFSSPSCTLTWKLASNAACTTTWTQTAKVNIDAASAAVTGLKNLLIGRQIVGENTLYLCGHDISGTWRSVALTVEICEPLNIVASTPVEFEITGNQGIVTLADVRTWMDAPTTS